MNSISNKVLEANCAAFSSRFPDLANILGLDRPEGAASLLAGVPSDFSLTVSASGRPTLSVRGAYLHSRYDPARDAERELDRLGESSSGCVFAGVGLGYLPELYAARYPDAQVVLVEPDLYIFILFLASRPLDSLFAHRDLVILAGAEPREVTAFLEKTSLEGLTVHEPPALTAPNRPWFDEFAAIRKRNREKREINANTLRRFGNLWLSNMCRNLAELRDRPGIASFADLFPDIPALVIAAGPSLDRVLPELPKLKRHCVIIAVDTAVRACVRSGVEPDFIVLVDPQYWNWRHLDGLSCPNSVLVTESAAWPAVFRFQCRAICLCSSLFPLGKFLEERTGARGELGAGGSVSTTAWDFARHLGSTDIVMAALDLGFPERKTHFTGSIFEERSHTASNRLNPAETAGYLALYGAGPYPVSDYRGNPVLTDKRLILYAWWFESRLAAYPAHKTRTLTPEGVRIPGFSVASVEELAPGADRREEIDRRLANAIGGSKAYVCDRDSFSRAIGELKEALADMKRLAREGCAVCDTWLAMAQKGTEREREILAKLDRIDREILANPAKEITAMVFDLAMAGKEGEGAEKRPEMAPILASRSLYRGIMDATGKNFDLLEKFA